MNSTQASQSRQLFAMTALLGLTGSAAALWSQYQRGAFDALDRVALPALGIAWVVLWLGLRIRKLNVVQAQTIIYSAYVTYFLLALNHQFKVFAPQMHMLSENTYWFGPLYAAAFMYFLPRPALLFSLGIFLCSLVITVWNFLLNPAMLGDGPLVASCIQFLLVGAAMTILQAVMGRRHAAMLASQMAVYQDALTGAANRRAAEERLLALQEQPQPYSVVLLDLDYFKRINDQHGHAIGDQVLRAVVMELMQAVPPGAMVARWGGEEFLLILPDLPSSQLEPLLHNIRRNLAAQQVGPVSGVTASFGVAQLLPDEQAPSLLVRADRALYEAKARGRDMVTFAV